MATRTRKTAAATTTATARTPESDLSFQNFLVELTALAAKYSNSVPAAVTEAVQDAADAVDDDADTDTTTKPARRTRGKAAAKTTAPAPEADEDDEDEEEEGPTRAELSKKSIAALRKLLKATGDYADEDVEQADKETCIAALLGELPDDEDDDDEDADDDSEDSEEDDEEGDDDDLRAEYEELSVAALRKKAREEYDATPTEIKGMKKEELIDFMLNPEEDDDAEDEGDAEEGYSEEELNALPIDELEAIAEEWELDLEENEVIKPKRLVGKAKETYKAELVDLLVVVQEEGEEEE